MTIGTRDRAAVNKANAQHSTGPRTAEGKAAARENAWRHGMRSERAVMPGEDPREFDALRHDLRQSYRPVGHHEEALVERIAIAEWKRRRFDAAEADIMWSILSCAEMGAKGRTPDHVVPERITRVILWANRHGLEHALELICRYRATVDRDWNRALAQLDRLQRQRERRAREAAEAEATLRVNQRANNGLSVRKLTRLLHVIRRDTELARLGHEPLAPLTGWQPADDATGTSTPWPSPDELASLVGLASAGSFGHPGGSGRRGRRGDQVAGATAFARSSCRPAWPIGVRFLRTKRK